jgi:hypothetical protein
MISIQTPVALYERLIPGFPFVFLLKLLIVIHDHVWVNSESMHGLVSKAVELFHGGRSGP